MANDAVRMELTEQSKVVIEKAIRFNALPELRRELTTATAPMAPAVKRAARSLPSNRKRVGAKSGSLRSALANAIQRKIKLSPKGLTILITDVPHGGKENLGRSVEGTIPWEHPTFGHPPVVTQRPMPFFYRTLNKYEPIIAARVKAVMDKLESEL